MRVIGNPGEPVGKTLKNLNLVAGAGSGSNQQAAACSVAGRTAAAGAA